MWVVVEVILVEVCLFVFELMLLLWILIVVCSSRCLGWFLSWVRCSVVVLCCSGRFC